MSQSIAFHTLGCRLNQSETASLENSFEGRGYTVVSHNQESDIAVINTCTVTENGDADTRRLVNRIVRKNPRVRIALVGCQAQVQKEKLTQLPNVRWVVGNQRKMDLADVLAEMPHPATAQVVAPTIERKPFVIPIAGVDRSHTRANLKIQDGCDFFCSFCEIPYARGRARSRVFDDILTEGNALAEAGHQEIILTGINIGTYQYQDKNLMDVIRSLEQIEKIKRIRISSIEPTTIPLELADMMQPGHKVCRYLHIPLQTGHDEILSAMKRKYTVAEFSQCIRDFRTRVAGICIGTDVIVGFPGESAAHFQATEQLLRELPIDYFHVFSYSERYQAKSSQLADPVPAQLIAQRSQALRELSQRKKRLYHESLLGSIHDVIFEERKAKAWIGCTDNYVKIQVESQQQLEGKMRKVKLVAVDDHYMRAEMYGD